MLLGVVRTTGVLLCAAGCSLGVPGEILGGAEVFLECLWEHIDAGSARFQMLVGAPGVLAGHGWCWGALGVVLGGPG